MNKKNINANDTLNSLAEKFDFKKADLLTTKLLAKISTAITKKRFELDMNQKQFAEFIGVSQGMISRWENGNCNFTIETLVHICDKLKYELEIQIKDGKTEYADTYAESKFSEYANFPNDYSTKWRGVA